MQSASPASPCWTRAWLGPLFALAAVVLFQGLGGPHPFDDAFITFRYARNLSAGLGFVYNPGERVLGTTTPLYTLLLAGLARLFGSPGLPALSFGLGLLADGLNVWLVFRLGEWIFRSRPTALLLAGLFLLQPFRLDVAAGGMETSLFLALLLLMYERFLVGGRSPLAGVWAGLALLTRPDALLAVAPLFLVWFWKDRRGALRAGLLAALVAAPWLAWSSAYFGSPIPHSLVAKSTAYRNPPGFAAYFLLSFLASGTAHPILPVPVLVLGSLGSLSLIALGGLGLYRHRPGALVVGVYPLLYAGAMSLANPALWFGWYFLPLMPGLLFLFAATVQYGLPGSVRLRFAALSVLAAVLFGVSLVSARSGTAWNIDRNREDGFFAACRGIEPQVRPGDWILAPDIGVLGWCLERANILDPIGLVSPASLPYFTGLPREQLVSPRLVADRRPRFVISLDYFVDPYLTADVEFNRAYQVRWQGEISLSGEPHQMYIFQRQE